jgi:predicted dehydrogenase
MGIVTTNIGVIGLGKMGILHSGILNAIPNCRLKAICEREGLLVKAAKAFLPKTTPIYADHLDMLEREGLEAVFVTTPIHTHVPIITDVAGSGREISVFVEKPLASTYREAQGACDAVRDMSGVHMVGFQKRFSPVFQRAREYLGEGLIGDLLFFRAYSFSSDVLRRGNSWRFRRGTGGGVLLDLAPHLLDLLLWFFGMPSTVQSMNKRIFSGEVEDYVNADLCYDGGLKGTLDMC